MKKISLLFILSISCLLMSAQDKESIPMSVPDSLLHFDYQFDYSVFESPYKGAYEFSPYMVKLNPSKSVYDGRSLSLRAGLGYSFRPEIDIYWTPIRKDNLSLSVYNSGRGYVGKYYFTLGGGSEFKGSDISDGLGIQFRQDCKNAFLDVKAGWDGIFTTGNLLWSRYNSVYAQIGLRSKEYNPSTFYYDLNLDYRFSMDAMPGIGSTAGNYISVYGTVGPFKAKHIALLMDVEASYEKLLDDRDGMDNISSLLISAAPKMAIRKGIFAFDLGLKVDISNSGTRPLSLSPRLLASAEIIQDKLGFYLGLTGGQNLHSYHSMKAVNHWQYRENLSPAISLTRYDAFLGFEGGFLGCLDYELKAGYRKALKAPVPYYNYRFADVKTLYVESFVSWNSERLSVDANLRLVPYENVEEGSRAVCSPFASADIRGLYSWDKRISFGAELEFVTNCKSAEPVPVIYKGFISPSLFGEYKFDSNLGAWAKLGNLLGQATWTTPGVTIKGPYFTIGVSYNY